MIATRKTLALSIFAAAAALLLFSASAVAIPKSTTPPISPSWVFDHWVWEDDVNTSDAVMTLVDGYAAHNIPVGAVIVDSPWSTEYNNFVWNNANYPNAQAFIDQLHARNIKVVLWCTSMLNKESDKGSFEPTENSSYLEALQKGYLTSDGRLTNWWKGNGGYIDYTNPQALEWWHGLLDRVLLMGIDGWKLDGTDPLFPGDGYGMGGPLGPKKYKDLYYMDMYEHLLKRNPNGATMSRSIDLKAVNPKGFSPISHSPANWVGDQRHDWTGEGFLEALQNIFDSARLGYTVVGSDIAGYNGSMAITKNLLLRWTQFGALNPFMENGGHGAHEPWKHDPQTVQIYRKFVMLHLELKPYFYSLMMNAHLGGKTIMRPQPGTWQYKLGDDLFVSVLYEDKDTRDVTFPEGKWIDYWDNTKTYSGRQPVKYTAPIDRYPLFVRSGAIIPLYVADNTLGHGDSSFINSVTLDIYPDGNSSFALYEENKSKVDVAVSQAKDSISISVRPAKRPFVFRVMCPRAPKSVTASNGKLRSVESPENIGVQTGAYSYNAATKRLYINPTATDRIELDIKLK